MVDDAVVLERCGRAAWQTRIGRLYSGELRDADIRVAVAVVVADLEAFRRVGVEAEDLPPPPDRPHGNVHPVPELEPVASELGADGVRGRLSVERDGRDEVRAVRPCRIDERRTSYGLAARQDLSERGEAISRSDVELEITSQEEFERLHRTGRGLLYNDFSGRAVGS